MSSAETKTLRLKHDTEGKVFKSKSCGSFVVTKYAGAKAVHIKFLETGYETVTAMSHIQSGKIRDRLKPSVYGVGVLGVSSTVENDIRIKEYFLWKDMLYRCYSSSFHKKCSTYKDCNVSENFKYFPYFKDWCNRQVGFGNKDWELDKDILVKGNKLYSEDTCCFVPKEVNMLFVKSDARRGNLPVGVYYRKDRNKFKSSFHHNGQSYFIGHFDTEEDAFLAYKDVKEKKIRGLAEKYKDELDVTVYNALINYQVEITD